MDLVSKAATYVDPKPASCASDKISKRWCLSIFFSNLSDHRESEMFIQIFLGRAKYLLSGDGCASHPQQGKAWRQRVEDSYYRASQRSLPTHLVDHPLLVSIKHSIGLVWRTRQNNIDRATRSSNSEPYTNLEACFIFLLFSDALTLPIVLRGIVWPVLRKTCLCLEDAEQWSLTATGTSADGTERGRSYAASIAPSISFPSSRMKAAQKAERYVHYVNYLPT